MVKYSEEWKDGYGKSVSKRITNKTLMLRVRKLEQWEELLAERTEDPSVPARTYDILELTIGASTIVTDENLVRGINLL